MATPPTLQIEGQTALEAWQSHLTPQPSQHGEEGSSFPDCVLPSDTINSESVGVLNLVILVW